MMWGLGGPCGLHYRGRPTWHPFTTTDQLTMSKTVKVRIAVSVDCNGDWSSAGWSSSSSEDFHSYTFDSLKPGENRYWLEAELEVPETKTITAQVSQLTQAG
jgi:hypothetical protein